MTTQLNRGAFFFFKKLIEGHLLVLRQCLLSVENKDTMEDCKKSERYEMGLFINFEKPINNHSVDFKQEPTYDAEEDCEKELVVGDVGPLLI